VASEEAEEFIDAHTDDGAGQARAEAERHSEWGWDREDPLTVGHVGVKDAISQPRGRVAHAASRAGRTDAALAGEGEDSHILAPVAAEADEAVGEVATGGQRSELVHHERR
jgi:hypothetical protein